MTVKFCRWVLYRTRAGYVIFATGKLRVVYLNIEPIPVQIWDIVANTQGGYASRLFVSTTGITFQLDCLKLPSGLIVKYLFPCDGETIKQSAIYSIQSSVRPN